MDARHDNTECVLSEGVEAPSQVDARYHNTAWQPRRQPATPSQYSSPTDIPLHFPSPEPSSVPLVLVREYVGEEVEDKRINAPEKGGNMNKHQHSQESVAQDNDTEC